MLLVCPEILSPAEDEGVGISSSIHGKEITISCFFEVRKSNPRHNHTKPPHVESELRFTL